MAANRTDPLVLFAFDLLFFNGKNLRRLPLTERKAQLARLLSATPRKRILYVDHIENAGKVFFDICCEAGLEGIVSKRKDRPYIEGRSDWVKRNATSRRRWSLAASSTAAPRSHWANCSSVATGAAGIRGPSRVHRRGRTGDTGGPGVPTAAGLPVRRSQALRRSGCSPNYKSKSATAHHPSRASSGTPHFGAW